MPPSTDQLEDVLRCARLRSGYALPTPRAAQGSPSHQRSAILTGGPFCAPIRGPVCTPIDTTWFAYAMADFARTTGMLVELTLEDEGHTADRLRTGEVLAVVTSDPEPVAGCRTIALGSLSYVACASPDFVGRYFPTGIDKDSLNIAPVMRFNRKDQLQGRWAKAAFGADLNAPTHWIPSTQGFLDLACAGLGWGLQPKTLAKPRIDAGTLIELVPGDTMDVPLFWTVSRLHAQALQTMTEAVRNVAEQHLYPVAT